ncbi:hypothetical protein BDU57DRAFT_166474 [Ampelomyces quisqualis]|uniref:Uncharacterized protein n=1 Tax=Ampelomyces quisqualis TaxID=50730 RepID=A0A6A5QRJ8_AMPQU|nr:hypothetical protein BDU57DRAFT_166474 [Ampelomyces quisqualis]
MSPVLHNLAASGLRKCRICNHSAKMIQGQAYAIGNYVPPHVSSLRLSLVDVSSWTAPCHRHRRGAASCQIAADHHRRTSVRRGRNMPAQLYISPQSTRQVCQAGRLLRQQCLTCSHQPLYIESLCQTWKSIMLVSPTLPSKCFRMMGWHVPRHWFRSCVLQREAVINIFHPSRSDEPANSGGF